MIKTRNKEDGEESCYQLVRTPRFSLDLMRDLRHERHARGGHLFGKNSGWQFGAGSSLACQFTEAILQMQMTATWSSSRFATAQVSGVSSSPG
jgi:hypothetical protein